MSIVQATVAAFSPETHCGTVLLDTGAEVPFDAAAFAHSRLRMLRLGQRVIMRMDHDHVVALTHISFPLVS